MAHGPKPIFTSNLMLNKKLLIWTFFVLLSLFSIGFGLSKNRALWNDEIYTQMASVSSHSYSQIWLGHVGEGSASPLFYVMQKFLCEVLRYSAPDEWKKNMGFEDPKARIILRLNSIFFMSFSVGLIFYFFSRFYSLSAGGYALFVSLSSYMVWAFWAEGRPYALWFFFTTAQSLIFLCILHQKKISPSSSAWLSATHFFLSLSSVFSLIQIVIVSGFIWFLYERNWKRYILRTVIPSVICVYYYTQSPKYAFWFADGPLQLINANIPKDRLILIFIFFIFLVLSYAQKKFRMKIFENDSSNESAVFFWFTALMLFATGLVLLKFKLTENLLHQGFQVSSRYFIYLTPVGIIAASLFSIQMLKLARGKTWLKWGVIAVIIFLSFIRVERTYALVRSYYHI